MQSHTVHKNDVVPSPNQPRRSFDAERITGMRKSIEKVGLLQPLLVYKTNADDKFHILDGEQRWRAIQESKTIETISAIVVDEPPDDATRLERSLIANVARESLNAIESALAVKRVMNESGKSASAIATSLSVSEASVSRWLALLTLPDQIQQFICSGDISAATGYQISLSGTESEQLALAEKIIDEGLSRDAVAGKAKTRRKAGKDKSPHRKQRVNLPLGEHSIVVSGPELSLDRLIESFNSLAAKARKAKRNHQTLPTFVSLLRDEAAKTGSRS